MTLKNLPDHFTSRTSAPAPGELSNINHNRKIDRSPGTREESEGLAVLNVNRLYPALRELMGLDNYRLALVSGSEWARLEGAAESPSAAAPSVVMHFNWKELVTRAYEFGRDSSSEAERRVAQFADVCVDFIKMKVSRLSGEVINLTNQEYKTLKYFLSNPDRVLSRDELLNEAWGYQNYPTTRTVDNHVLKLRQKLERDPARPVHFLTLHKVGYKFVP